MFLALHDDIFVRVKFLSEKIKLGSEPHEEGLLPPLPITNT